MDQLETMRYEKLKIRGIQGGQASPRGDCGSCNHGVNAESARTVHGIEQTGGYSCLCFLERDDTASEKGEHDRYLGTRNGAAQEFIPSRRWGAECFTFIRPSKKLR